MSKLIIDHKARIDAINPSQSFIVQAPAGSGKTELLTQRFLQLLCYTEKNPEEIIAITFTRKAAAEMRQRIITALQAAHDEKPTTPHKQLTWQLARKALARDQKLHWQLLQNPNRLRIMTIDALSTYLVKQMPLSAKLSPQLNILDNPYPYYREAAEQILLTHSTELETLLLHLDNRVYLLENLLVEILSKREQWLPHIVGHQSSTAELRNYMENALRNVMRECLQTVKTHLNDDVLCELIPLADFAGHYCVEKDPENPIAHCNNLMELSDSIEAFPVWQGIANLLLTQKGEWRKNITKRQGFPAKSQLKPQMMALLATLSTDDTLKADLHTIMLCPPCIYDDQQWVIIEALMTLLPLLAAQLNVIFTRDCVTDFVELNLAALRALGDDENPTDLALHLDYRINHLLIDEFQDTSVIQFELIEKLIAGWSPNDGRSIFLVGDPMQSIYRFRNAEVGLFIRAQQQGIGQLSLKNLTLQQNFRSYQAIVNWNNHNFDTIFPDIADITVGATPYSPADANHDEPGSVKWHPSINDNRILEAKQVIAQIKTLQQHNADDSIAILVRSRRHLDMIIEMLHQHNMAFQAIDLEPLADLIEIQDIHSLTRALLHRADSIAWLAILRAPYCGLSLIDLTVIVEATKGASLWRTIKNYTALNLTPDATLRLQHILPALHNVIESIGRQPFSQLLRQLWRDLSGPATLTTAKQDININSYFKLIEELESQHHLLSLDDIEHRLNTLYAEPNPDINTNLQIMTIHKAKGLEFDHVLLPGLHRKAPYDRYQILKWLERPNLFGDNDLILAPIKAIDQATDPIYDYLRRVDKTKSDYERARLLYVATTRAKKSLHLFANAILEEEQIKPPSKNSFLELLWHNAKTYFIDIEEKTTENIEKKPSHYLRRFTKDALQSNQTVATKTITHSSPVNINLPSSTPRHVGTTIHETLQQIALTGSTKQDQWPLRLKQLGVADTDIPSCLQTIKQAIDNTQQDSRGQWILSPNHQNARCELPLTFIDDNEIKQLIIDRTFIDNGVRWIIDYKTGTPTAEELEQYKQQLEGYAKAFERLENYPIRLALYFPLNGEWLEWKFNLAMSG